LQQGSKQKLQECGPHFLRSSTQFSSQRNAQRDTERERERESNRPCTSFDVQQNFLQRERETED
jgi:hypothetical protein